MNNLIEVEINLKNLAHNVEKLKGLLRPPTKFMAVVKANAYGHGMISCARSAINAGADWLGVVDIKEALALRDSKIKAPILVLGYVDPKDFFVAADNNISIAIVNFEQLGQLSNGQMAKLLKNKKIKIHLKIETGINRLGFVEENWPKLIKKLKELPKNIIIEGIYSHFASVEEHDLPYAKKQIDKFKKFKKLFESRYKLKTKSHKPIYHMAASASAMILPESHFDMVRCGISIYGLWPSRETKTNFQFLISNFRLKPVLSYKTKIVQVKEVEKGELVGYGCTYRAPKKMEIAVLPVGYYEGIDRGLSNSGKVLISSQECPIIGRICMNMTVIDISRLNVKPGEEVVLVGEQGNKEITADDWANRLNTINYEITTRIPEHIPRIYK